MAVVSKKVKGGLIRHYSNANKKIKQVETGLIYIEAVDVSPCKYTYEETDIEIEVEETDEGAAE